MSAPELRTERVVLRRWRQGDHQPFAELNADPVVMEHFPAPLTEIQSNVFAELLDAGLAARRYGLWAIEVPDVADFVGFVGLAAPTWEASCAPCVEIGWRIARPYWGRGYVTEAGREVVRHAFAAESVGGAGLEELVSFTVPANVRSRAVMERLGFSHDPADDFDHPNLEVGHPLRPHVLYRLQKP